jgi:hypothetical protein
MAERDQYKGLCGVLLCFAVLNSLCIIFVPSDFPQIFEMSHSVESCSVAQAVSLC